MFKMDKANYSLERTMGVEKRREGKKGGRGKRRQAWRENKGEDREVEDLSLGENKNVKRVFCRQGFTFLFRRQ